MRWVHTSDTHGVEVAKSLRKVLKADVLSDGGDNLQGTAWTAFANDRCGEHLVAQEMNEAGYDLGVIGNHDIEAGREVMGRWIACCRFPVLCANAKVEGAKPYVVIEKEGMRIAAIGMVTAAVRLWVDEEQRSMCVPSNIVESMRKWVAIIRQTEHVDAIFALLHSGWEGRVEGENVVRRVAEEVDGLDAILYGHDHHAAIHRVKKEDGREVVCVGAGCLGMTAGVIDVWKDDTVKVEAQIVECPKPDDTREVRFPEYAEWLKSPVCHLVSSIDESDSFFGPSRFLALFHDMQFDVTKADVSISSPMTFDSFFQEGQITMRDLFRLYRFNTKMYVLRMKGDVLRQVLEWSYSLWANTMRSADDEALLMDYVLDNGTRKGLKNISLNMLSAAGVEYEVNLREAVGRRVRLKLMSDGSVFDGDMMYSVAVNSYHGTMMLSRWECKIEHVWDDYRECLLGFLRTQETYEAKPYDNWRFVPEEWTNEALKRDRITLFSEEG